jgi:hypothetical protein
MTTCAALLGSCSVRKRLDNQVTLITTLRYGLAYFHAEGWSFVPNCAWTQEHLYVAATRLRAH